MHCTTLPFNGLIASPVKLELFTRFKKNEYKYIVKPKSKVRVQILYPPNFIHLYPEVTSKSHGPPNV